MKNEKEFAVNEQVEENQYLSFTLGDERFGFDVLSVTGIEEFDKITVVPKTPKYISGVMNLRGSVIPVIDLRLKLGMEKKEVTVDTSIIVLEVRYEDEIIIMGALVDAVHEVLRFTEDEIEAPPGISAVEKRFVSGMGKTKDEFVIILDVNTLFSPESLIESEYKVAGDKVMPEAGR